MCLQSVSNHIKSLYITPDSVIASHLHNHHSPSSLLLLRIFITPVHHLHHHDWSSSILSHFQHGSRCAPELLTRNLTGKTYLITGANSGVGLATSAQLMKQGAHVIMGCRRVSAGQEAAATIQGIGSTASVRSCAKNVLAKHDRLDALVNNAGIMGGPFGLTKDGFEKQFGVNHLGHFLLTELLRSVPARIVNLSSVSHAGSPKTRPTIDFDDMKWEKRGYDQTAVYSSAKLANVLYSKYLARKHGKSGITAVSVHPGWMRSNLAAGLIPIWVQNIAMRPMAPFVGLMSIEDGAQTSLHCILADDVPEHNGAYYSQNSILYSDRECKAGGWPLRSPNPNAHDHKPAEKLYIESRKMVGFNKI